LVRDTTTAPRSFREMQVSVELILDGAAARIAAAA
jgi:hypothetical protein